MLMNHSLTLETCNSPLGSRKAYLSPYKGHVKQVLCISLAHCCWGDSSLTPRLLLSAGEQTLLTVVASTDACYTVRGGAAVRGPVSRAVRPHILGHCGFLSLESPA